MAGNSNLKDSVRQKQDEFYTQLSLVESEMKHSDSISRVRQFFATVMTPMKAIFSNISQ